LSGNGSDDSPTSEPPAGLAPAEGESVPPLTREQIEALRGECAELRDQLLRRRADFENYRKRVERDRQAVVQETEADVIRDLVPTLDNLDRALEAASGDDPLRAGVELIRRELLAVLEARGVVAFDPTGNPFDPELHQALSHEPAAHVPDGTVLEVLRKGYRLKDRLLRPALVKVAKGRDDGGPEALH
jgi:molecular chaperone GrpE